MKNFNHYKLLLIVTSLIQITFNNNLIAQSAHTNLDNLTSPVKIPQSLLPVTDSSVNIGSAAKAWKNIYNKGSIYYGNTRSVFFKNTNTAIGLSAMITASSGTYNTAAGYQSLYFNVGTGNTAAGAQSLYSNTSGSYNNAFGTYALFTNKSGSENTGLGFSSLKLNTTGSYNTAVGKDALYSDTSGYENTAIGHGSMFANTKGYENCALGRNALHENDYGSNNVAIGYEASFSSTSGYRNNAIGYDALYYNTGGGENVADGCLALAYADQIFGNTAVGYATLYGNGSGDYNTAVGFEADVSGSDFQYSSAFGYEAYITASNQIRIGDNSITSIGGYVNWSNISDGRVKKNIKQNVPGLVFINKLQPVTYNLDLDAADKILQRRTIKDNGKTIVPPVMETNARLAKEKILYTGFVAQDVEKAAKELNFDFSGIDAAKNDKDLYGLRYADFVVPLVKAVQELSKQNDSLKLKMHELDNLQAENEELKTRLNLIEQKLGLTNNAAVNISTAWLSQNAPNPFSNSTSISYTLPKTYSSAKIIITDKNGTVLKQVNISGNKGSISINAAMLSSGAYQYALYIDSKLVDTKQMLLAK